MSKPVVEVQVRTVAAASDGCAVFLGNEDKVFVMFVGSFDERGNKVRLARPSGLDTAADALLWLHSGQERHLSVYLATAKRNYWTDCK